MLNKQAISPLSESVTRLGKYSKTIDGAASFFWTGSGIEFTSENSSLYIDVESDFSDGALEIWLTVEVDGSLIQRICLNQGRQTVCLFRNAEPKARIIRVLKESQIDFYATMHALRIHSISTKDNDGLILLDPPAHKLNIEFIGDSITSGEGLNGAVGEMSFTNAFFGYKNNYSLKTADALDAYYTVSSQSGWGFYCGYNNSVETAIPKVYFKEELFGEKLVEDRPSKDLIVINLGTNDYTAFTTPEWTDPKTGISYKLSLDADGKMMPDDAAKLISTGIEFINSIRAKNPSSKILWTYGMYGTGLQPVLDEICKETGIEFIAGADCLETKDFGSREHPSANIHARTSEILIDKIRDMLK